MATGGGKPGVVVKAQVMADRDNGRIIVTPRDPDDALWNYLAKEGTSEFVVQFLDVADEHSGSGSDQ